MYKICIYVCVEEKSKDLHILPNKCKKLIYRGCGRGI